MQRKPRSKIVTLHSGQLECKCKVGKEEEEGEEASQKLEIEPAHCQENYTIVLYRTNPTLWYLRCSFCLKILEKKSVAKLHWHAS